MQEQTIEIRNEILGSETHKIDIPLFKCFYKVRFHYKNIEPIIKDIVLIKDRHEVGKTGFV